MNKWHVWWHIQDINRFVGSTFWRMWWVGWFVYTTTTTILAVINVNWVTILVGVPFMLYYGWNAWPTLMGRHATIWKRGPFKKGQRVRVFDSKDVYAVVGDGVLVLESPPTRHRPFWIARPEEAIVLPKVGVVDSIPLRFGDFARVEMLEVAKDED